MKKVTMNHEKNLLWILSYYESLHTENREQNIPNLVEKAPNEELNRPFNFEELKRVIKKMKNKKAEGVDKIANEMIKHFPDKIPCLILDIIDSFFRYRQGNWRMVSCFNYTYFQRGFKNRSK